MNHIKDWSAPIEGLRKAFGTANRPKTSKPRKKPIRMMVAASSTSRVVAETETAPSHNVVQITLPPNASEEAVVAQNDILTLFRALRHSAVSSLHTILSNVELMAFATSWFAQVMS
jgi:hypothetical protein